MSRADLRVLHVAQPTTAGVARVVADAVRDQAGRGWDVTVACPADGWLGKDVEVAGARWSRWEATREPGPTVPHEVARLRRIVRIHRPDVVHLHSSKAGLIGRLVVRGAVPTVFQPNAWSFRASDSRSAQLAVHWERFAVRWTAALAVVSVGEQRAGEEAGIRAAWVEIGNGVDLRQHPLPSQEERLSARAALGVSGPLAVCVGRLSRQKGQDVLLAAWPMVRDQLPAAELVLVGDGPERSALERLLPPGVRLTGDVRDPRPWLRAADVVVQPSRWEGLSLALLEALATGRCVVASDVEGMTDAISPGGGTVVPPEAPGPLATAVVQRLLDPDLAAAEGAQARRTAVERFDIAVVADRIARLYERLLVAST